MPSIQVVPRTLSSCRDERVFLFIEKRSMQVKNKFSDKLAYPKIYYDLFAEQRYRKSEGFEVHSSVLQAFSEMSSIFISTVKQRQKPHHHKTHGR